ncbi:MAG: helix-turn-helix domain-containing protein [Alphaproteobacteria bacterium]|nr:helix-turn-helix domain-containing protein [Alphaproteobacteria bacterium]
MRGTVLAAWRRDLGWSQEQLAEELGVERQVIDDWEQAPDISPLIDMLLSTLRATLAELKAAKPS